MKLEIRQTKRIKTGSPDVFSCEIPARYVEVYKSIIRANPEQVSVTIGPAKKHRSTGPNSANAHFNGHVQQIAMQTRNTFEDVKLYVKRQAFAQGLPFLKRSDGSVVMSLSDGQPLPISESDMDNLQCGWCIDQCHILAADHGIVLVEE